VTSGAWVNDGVWPMDNASGVFHIFTISQVLTAVPEPSTLLMASTAIIAVGAFWRSARRRDEVLHFTINCGVWLARSGDCRPLVAVLPKAG
jgi:hypothetical protein